MILLEDMHPLQWFIDRVGSFISRGTTEVFINDDAMAEKLFNMQTDDYQFNEKICQK